MRADSNSEPTPKQADISIKHDVYVFFGFLSYGSTVTSFRYSLIRLDSYRPIVVARSSNAPKEIAIEILSLRVFSQTESFTLCEQARSVNELQAVKQWVMTLSR